MKKTIWIIASFMAFLSSFMLVFELFQVSQLPGSGLPPLEKDYPYVVRVLLVLAFVNLGSISALTLLGKVKFFPQRLRNGDEENDGEKTKNAVPA
ncbi:hypothetical protein Pan258_42160 [Symmachiella dynata]|uniref:hypothetical protein n=1 Tax=Symmachiella dynata TaxID=2527995 RepID=UPI00118A47F0|nr:hypothetical protein [Symmachiella dynata]QDT50159.1 hypothetical protein Pan258_42160 [Symmachiella dynata]